MATNAGSVLVHVGADIGGFTRNMARAHAGMGGFGKAAIGAMVGVGAAVGAVGISSLKAAGEFEQSLNVFQAVSQSTGTQMKSVSTLAKRLGRDFTLPATSAKDAAEAMTELAKGGLSVKNTMKAAKGVLQLSAAAQIGNAEAATIAARALKAFGLSGDQAVRVADVLANAANTSTGEIGDFALGLQQSSAVAKSWGLTINQTTAALMQLADAGVVGSDAGTSLKTMLQSLVPTGKKAREAMQDLGVHTFDANGKFVGIRSIVDQYSKSLKGLTQEQQLAALKTIFGSDAVRAANILLKDSVAEHDKYVKATERQGAAADLAAAKTKGFKGSLEAFKSTVETLQIELGEKLVPAATAAMRGLSNFVGKLSEAQGMKAKISVVLEGAEAAATKAKQVGVDAGKQIADALGKVNWAETGNRIAAGIGAAFKKGIPLLSQFGETITAGFAKAIEQADWGVIGAKIGAGIKDGVKKAAKKKVEEGLEETLRSANSVRVNAAALSVAVDVATALADKLGLTAKQKVEAGLAPVPALVKAGIYPAIAVARAEGTQIGYGLGGGLIAALSGVGASVAQTIIAQIQMSELQIKQKYGIHSPSTVWADRIGKPMGQGIVVGIVAALKAGAAATMKELSALDKQLAGIQDRRAAQDRARAVMEAQQAVADARKKGEGVAQAEQALARAREDIAMAAMEKRAERLRAIHERENARIELVTERLKNAQEKAAEKMARVLERARDRAGSAFETMQSKILRGFDAGTSGHRTGSERALDEIRARREQEDLARAVTDAEHALQQARDAGDTRAIADAEIRLARAREDVTVSSLERTAAAERTTWEQQREALKEQLEGRLTTMKDALAREGSAWSAAMESIKKMLAEYGIDFEKLGGLLGADFVNGLKAAIGAAATASANIKGGSSSTMNHRQMELAADRGTTINVNVPIRGSVIAQSQLEGAVVDAVRNYTRTNGPLGTRSAGFAV